MSLLLLLKPKVTEDTTIPQVGASYGPLRRKKLKPKPKKKRYAEILREELAKQFDKWGRPLAEATPEAEPVESKALPVLEVSEPVKQAAQVILQSVDPSFVSLGEELAAFNAQYSREVEARKLQAMQQVLMYLEQQKRAKAAIEALAKKQREEDEELLMLALLM